MFHYVFFVIVVFIVFCCCCYCSFYHCCFCWYCCYRFDKRERFIWVRILAEFWLALFACLPIPWMRGGNVGGKRKSWKVSGKGKAPKVQNEKKVVFSLSLKLSFCHRDCFCCCLLVGEIHLIEKRGEEKRAALYYGSLPYMRWKHHYLEKRQI